MPSQWAERITCARHHLPREKRARTFKAAKSKGCIMLIISCRNTWCDSKRPEERQAAEQQLAPAPAPASITCCAAFCRLLWEPPFKQLTAEPSQSNRPADNQAAPRGQAGGRRHGTKRPVGGSLFKRLRVLPAEPCGERFSRGKTSKDKRKQSCCLSKIQHEDVLAADV